MTYQRFEDLPVWNEAIALAHGVYDLFERADCKVSFSLRDQLERASLSVSNNVAEGFERGTKNELLNFLYIARGSSGEARSLLRFLAARKRLEHLHADIALLQARAESCSRQIKGWADSLQNSDLKGQRHVTTRGRLDEAPTHSTTASPVPKPPRRTS